MHILLAVLGGLSALGVLLWRIQSGMHAAREIKDFAEGAINLPRKLAFRRKSGKSGSSLVEDPREAATILMLEVARAGGDVTRTQKDVIERLVSENFGFSASDAEEVIVQAAWVSEKEARTDALLRRMARVVSNTVSRQELIELKDMMVEVSAADGEPNQNQLDTITEYQTLVGLTHKA